MFESIFEIPSTKINIMIKFWENHDMWRSDVYSTWFYAKDISSSTSEYKKRSMSFGRKFFSIKK